MAIFFAHVANGEGGIRVAVYAVDVARHIQVHDVAVL